MSALLCQGKQRAVDLVAAREDAELQQKFSSELQDIPNTIPAFKCVLLLLDSIFINLSCMWAAPRRKYDRNAVLPLGCTCSSMGCCMGFIFEELDLSSKEVKPKRVP